MRGMFIRSIGELRDFAKEIIDSLRTGDRATIIALDGDLGSGKTTFSKCVAAILGVESQVQSPTFVIMKSYEIQNDERFNKLVHIDAYRLDDPKQADQIHWDELTAGSKTLVLVEWPEKLGDRLPLGTTRICFSFVDETTREVSVVE
jgi:tRNA threonylcarbamoyladenosine biosynthesis protein TsaE